MEKLKPAISKSSISSLRFQSKPDFDKFLKFIKKETKDLKDIETPKDGITKKVIGAGAAGLGLLGLSLLFKGKGTGSGGEGDDNFTFAVGREDDIPPRPPFGKPKPEAPKNFEKLTRRGTRTFSQRGELAKAKRGRKEARKIRKRFNTKVTSNVNANQVGVGGGSKKTTVAPESKLKPERPLRGSGKKYGAGDATFESGSVDLNNTERQFSNRGRNRVSTNRKLGFPADANIPKSVLDEVKRINETLSRTTSPSKIKRLTQRLEDLRRNSGAETLNKFKQRRPGSFNFSKTNPFNRFGNMYNTIMSKNPFKKGALSKIFDSKVTADTIFPKALKIPTKGKFFTKAGMFFNHPIPKGITFLLTAYDAYQEGKSIVNLKDNIFTAIYDLGVAVNNELFFPNDMSKHKLYITESSNDKIKAHKNDKNNAIKEFRNKVSSDGGGTKILIAPTDNGQNNTSSNNIPSTSGGDKVSFIPMEPLNIGEDILLYKLNA